MEESLRARVRRIVDASWFANAVILVIVLNAVFLGLETYDTLSATFGGYFAVAEHTFVTFFAVELAMKLYVRGWAFFRDPWNWFDFLVVAIALVPASQGFSVLRLLRILRVLRLISAVPQMRLIVSALFRSVPGMGTVIGLLLIVVYTAGVFGEKLFSETDPEHFGDLGTTLYTMFILMTTENWPDIAQPVLDEHPMAWMFFVGYIVVTAFVILNLVIGVIVTSLQDEVSDERWEEDQQLEQRQHEAVLSRLDELAGQVARLTEQVAELRGADTTDKGGSGPGEN